METQDRGTLAVFGATGRTGRPLLQKALNEGYRIQALVRDPARLGVNHPRLTVIQGDATDAGAVDRTVAGTTAVISALGPVKGSPPNFLTDSGKAILAAMQRHGVRRLLVVSGAGVLDPRDGPSAMRGVIRTIMKVVSPAVLRDSEAFVDLVRASGLDYTVVRGPVLTEDPGTGAYRTSYAPPRGVARLSRLDLADFLLKALNDPAWVGQAPIIAPAGS